MKRRSLVKNFVGGTGSFLLFGLPAESAISSTSTVRDKFGSCLSLSPVEMLKSGFAVLIRPLSKISKNFPQIISDSDVYYVEDQLWSHIPTGQRAASILGFRLFADDSVKNGLIGFELFEIDKRSEEIVSRERRHIGYQSIQQFEKQDIQFQVVPFSCFGPF
ncbi:MAG: hypothetical protein R3293_26945 [Candidatus Promineifilaceae bacterium]|nr:hypothetical protein [Candidatus Promineifilaceae bacterium]